MKYLDYFKDKIKSVPLPIAAQTVETLLVQLFSAFTELVESQINFLHQATKLHLVSNALPLLQYIRGNNIKMTFNTPNIYKCTLLVYTNGTTTWLGQTITDDNTSFQGDKSILKLINTVLIPAKASTTSDTIEITLYDVTDRNKQNYNFSGDEYIELNNGTVWSESIEVYVNGTKWKAVNYMKEANVNSFIVTMNEFKRPVIVFPTNKPVGFGEIYYRISNPSFNTNIKAVISNIQSTYNTVLNIVDYTKFSGVPVTSQLKNIVQLYYENNNWSAQKVVSKVLTINGILQVKLTRLDTKVINIEITTVDNTLNGYLGLILYELKDYIAYSGDEVRITLGGTLLINMQVNITGTETSSVYDALFDYLSNNNTLKIGDIYQLIESKIVGNSQIVSAEFTPVMHVHEMNSLTLTIENQRVLQESLLLQVVAVSSTTCAIYEIVNGQSIFITNILANGVSQYVVLTNDINLKIALVGTLTIGYYNLYEYTPSLLTNSEVTPNYSFRVGTLSVTFN
jgi:hypothetical protein